MKTQERIIRKRPGQFLNALLQLLFAACAAACGFASAGIYMGWNLYKPGLWDRFIYTFAVSFIDEAGRERFIGNAVMAAAASGIIAVLLFVLLIVLSGKYRRTQNGEVYLGFWDRIWSELHFMLFGVSAALSVFLCLPIAEIVSCDTYLDFFRPYQISTALYAGVPNDTALQLCGAGMFLALFIALQALLAVVRKCKAHRYWECSLLGILWFAVAGFFRRSSDSLFSALMPKAGEKLREIEQGVEKVRGGDLEWKIPVGTETAGFRGELNRLAEGINDISSAAEAAVQGELKNQRMKTALISNVSHDLKTPLTSMISYIDLLKKEGLSGPHAEEYLNIIDQKTQRLRQLTENLFDAAKAASGSLPCRISDIDLEELVNQAVGETDEKLRARGLDVIISCRSKNPMVRADGQLLWRVIDNLLSNACKYAMGNSRVYIDISDIAGEDGAAGFVGLQVKNMSRDRLNISVDELMERFTRGDQSRNTEGSGLGLSIAKDLTQLMHGSFDISVDGDLFKALLVLEQAPALQSVQKALTVQNGAAPDKLPMQG